MAEILIKKACSENIDSIEELYNKTIDWLNGQGIHQWKRGVYPTRSTAQDSLKSDNLYCCFTDGKLAGTFVLNEDQPRQYDSLKWKYNDGKMLVLHTFIIDPEETGKGIGKSVMRYVLSYALENGFSSIRLDAFPDNKAATALYLSLGFEFVGKVFFEYKEPGYEWYDCYEKLINPQGA